MRGLCQPVFTGVTFNHGVSGIAGAFEGDHAFAVISIKFCQGSILLATHAL